MVSPAVDHDAAVLANESPPVIGPTDALADCLAAVGASPEDVRYALMISLAVDHDPAVLANESSPVMAPTDALADCLETVGASPEDVRYAFLVSFAVDALVDAARFAGFLALAALSVILRECIPPPLDVSLPTPDEEWQFTTFSLE
jgi:hypothetical protein